MSLPPEEIEYQLAHSSDDRGWVVIVISVIFGFTALVCVLFRLASRRLSSLRFAIDDYLIMISMGFGIGLVITTCLMGVWGVGRHLVTISKLDLLHFGKNNLALQTFYPGAIGFARLSILALYHRIFGKGNKSFRIGLYICVIYNILWMIGVWLVVYLQCMPLSRLWTGQCAPKWKVTLSTSMLNIVADICVLALPQRLLWKLQMPLQKKLGISLLLLLGAFATIVSLARLLILEPVQNGNPKAGMDVTWTALNTFIFTVIEPTVAIICACLPTMQALFRHLKSLDFGTSLIQSLLRTNKSKSSQMSGPGQTQESRVPTNWYRMEDTSSSSSRRGFMDSSTAVGAAERGESQIWKSTVTTVSRDRV